jgi:hypothetical protein
MCCASSRSRRGEPQEQDKAEEGDYGSWEVHDRHHRSRVAFYSDAVEHVASCITVIASRHARRRGSGRGSNFVALRGRAGLRPIVVKDDAVAILRCGGGLVRAEAAEWRVDSALGAELVVIYNEHCADADANSSNNDTQYAGRAGGDGCLPRPHCDAITRRLRVGRSARRPDRGLW